MLPCLRRVSLGEIFVKKKLMKGYFSASVVEERINARAKEENVQPAGGYEGERLYTRCTICGRLRLHAGRDRQEAEQYECISFSYGSDD